MSLTVGRTLQKNDAQMIKGVYRTKLIVLIVAIAATAYAGSSDKPDVEILTEKNVVSQTGYDFEFKTSDGVSRKEEGQLITVNGHQGIGVKGSYSYNAPNGLQYIVSFVADDKGFKPKLRVAST
ncbi:endocuticle structural glycoprotein SgAbd-5-like [Battus philenor]|uniref:endocuticle structural glycoprotein SgAbd-5-like n=1 Tax=Battus philenor TaxID=42288 RepID=UPI0035CEFE67